MQLLNVQEPRLSPDSRGLQGLHSALRQTCCLNTTCCSFEVNALSPELHRLKRHQGTNKEKALQEKFPQSLNEKKSSNAGAKRMADLQLCLAGQSHHLAQHSNTSGVKGTPSLPP